MKKIKYLAAAMLMASITSALAVKVQRIYTEVPTKDARSVHDVQAKRIGITNNTSVIEKIKLMAWNKSKIRFIKPGEKLTISLFSGTKAKDMAPTFKIIGYDKEGNSYTTYMKDTENTEIPLTHKKEYIVSVRDFDEKTLEASFN